MSIFLDIEFRTITCHKCGATYALNETYCQKRQDDGKGWHCPYCDEGTAYCDSEADKLRRQLALERSKHDQTQAALRNARADRDKAERREKLAKARERRLKTRAAAGVCACCNRTFQNLRRHMATKHPDFGGEE